MRCSCKLVMKYITYICKLSAPVLLAAEHTSVLGVSRGCHTKLVNVLRDIMDNRRGSGHGHGGNYFKNRKGELSTLKHIRNRQKQNSRNAVLPANTIDVCAVGSGHPGTPKSVYIPLGLFSYLFNCGEGTQRACLANKMRVSKITDVFFTSRSWENISGLLGLCLTMQGMDVPAVKIHGPPGLVQTVLRAGKFAYISKLVVVQEDFNTGRYEDSAMTVEYIVMSPRSDEQANKKSKLMCDDICVAYLLKPKPKLRNVILEKCVDLGITEGRMIGQLKRGQSVTLDNGRVVHPDEILSDPVPNKPFIILECQSEEHLTSLLEDERISDLSVDASSDSCPCLIVHLTPMHVFHSKAYQTWIKRFPESTNHIVMNDQCSGLYIEHTHQTQTMLNMIHPGIFPLLPDLNTHVKPAEDSNIQYAEACLQYVVRGKFQSQVLRDSCITLDPVRYKQDVLDNPETAKAFSENSQLLKTFTIQEKSFPEFLFLGTGSSEPNKTRNVSAIWINTSPEQSILLDCGENTLGQLIRHYGDQADDMLVKLRAILVSHLHTDHHLGTLSVAAHMRKVMEKRGLLYEELPVIAPDNWNGWCQFLPEVVTGVSGLTSFHSIRKFEENSAIDLDVEGLLKQLGMKQIIAVPVLHAAFPYGFVLKHETGWSVVYSGDTMPCPRLIQAGTGCDVLIHEATMEDDMQIEAAKKKHSTTSQAIEVGRQMKAKFILLTHFSQRYPKIPLFNDNFSENVGIAFDHMQISLKELPLLPKLLPVMKQVFSQDYECLEGRTQKRKWAADIEKVALEKIKAQEPPNVSSSI